MAILTIEELKLLFDPDRIEQLASDSGVQFGSVEYNETAVQTVITQAEGTIKNTLSLQYTVAELEADAGIKRITADIAMFYLETRRPPVSPGVTRLHDLALRFLKQLQEGSAKLTAVQQLLPAGETTVSTEATDSGYFDGGPSDL